jgi:PAS domain S-box-containing protein
MPEQVRAALGPGGVQHSIDAAEFRRRLRWLIFHTWNIPPVFGLGFILLIGVLTPAQLLGILTTPLEPAYILGWLAFAMWFLPRTLRPLADWLDARPGSSPAAAVRAVQRFALRYWATFLIYLVLAPVSVVAAAALYTDFVATPIALFRIELVALIVSIIVGLPIFFLIFDLFGQALGGLALTRPIVTIRTKVFLIGALVPLLIDTMLVQYYWTRTDYFTWETFGVWLVLELIAIGGSLIFAHSFGQSLAPLQQLIGAPRPLPQASVTALTARSTDELGLLTADYRELLVELRLQGEILELSNRLLRSAGAETGTAAVFNSVVELCRQAIGADQSFLVVHEPATHTLVGVAQTGAEYRPVGHYRLALTDQSLAVWVFTHRESVAVADAAADPRVSPSLRARFGIRSALATPLRLGDEVLGVLMVAHTGRACDYGARERALIEALAREAALALHAQRLREAREQAEVERLAQAEQVRLLMDATEEGIYGVDGDGRCTFINRAALRMLGYARPEDLLGRNLHELIHHTLPDGRPYPKEQCRVRQAMLAGETAHTDDEVHWRADGTSFPVEYWSRPIARGGQTVGTVVSFVDVTQRKHTEAELAQHRERLEELVRARTAEIETVNRELEAFSYSVSHDLRAPLRAIDGFAQALAEDFAAHFDDVTARDYLNRIRNGAQRMSALIDDMLQLSRISRAELRPVAVDLSAMAHEIVSHLAAAEPGRTVDVEIAPALTARGDARLLQIALTNLLDNAWKYTGKTPQARIEFGRQRRDDVEVFYVRDNGAGFDMRYADKLFGAFQRLHGAEFPGTGVGLATVQRIIHRHGGRVWAESEVGKGATFFFTLTAPVSAPSADHR